MRYLLFIILLVAILITAGCINGNQNTPVTPTSVTVNSSDPIVGIWQWTVVDSSKIYSFTFFPDGHYSYIDSSASENSSGMWSKINENAYNVTYSSGKIQTIIYNQSKDTFTIPEFPQVQAYRLGKEPVATILTIVPTPVPALYLKGSSECNSEIFINICLEKDVNVILENNSVRANGTIFFEPIKNPINYNLGQYDAYQSLKEATVSVKLKLYNNKSVKVAEISKSYSVDKNGKSHIELNTEISENNPIGWTYIISIEKNIEKNQDVGTTVTPTREMMTCNIVSSRGYRYGTEYTISGYVKQTGRSGTCIITAELFAGGQSVNSKDTPFYIYQGDTIPFSITVYDPQGTASKYQVSARISY